MSYSEIARENRVKALDALKRKRNASGETKVRNMSFRFISRRHPELGHAMGFAQFKDRRQLPLVSI